MLNFVALLLQTPGLCVERTLHAVEYFAGAREVTKAHHRRGRRVAAFEMKDHPKLCDFTGALGFCYATLLALRLAPGGIALAAPVCSTWVWINRSTSGRSRGVCLPVCMHYMRGMCAHVCACACACACVCVCVFARCSVSAAERHDTRVCAGRPLGSKRRPQVRNANEMVSKLVLLLTVLEAKSSMWIVEQPAGSLMIHHPRWVWFLRRRKVFRVFLHMADFGGGSAKPTWIYSNRPDIDGLLKYRTHAGAWDLREELVTKCYAEDGTPKITGAKGLKESQHYPRGFGEACASFYDEIELLLREPATASCKMGAQR